MGFRRPPIASYVVLREVRVERRGRGGRSGDHWRTMAGTVRSAPATERWALRTEERGLGHARAAPRGSRSRLCQPTLCSRGLTRGTGAGSPLHRRPRASPRFLGADPRLPAAAPAAHSAPDSGPAQGRRVSPLLCLAGATVCPAHSVIRCQHLLAYQASAHSRVF